MLFFKLEATEISYRAKILTIQIKKSEKVKIWCSWDYESEEELLREFINFFLQEEDKIIVGFNILKFDIPLLLLKTSHMENFEKFSMKINHSNIIDLFIVLTFQRKGKIKSFKDYCNEINIAPISREEILTFYHSGQYEKINGAILKNFEALEKLFKNMLKK
ncbi:MAG: 3'-5' exonuclease [Candidatus Altiarchaeota archaeon]